MIEPRTMRAWGYSAVGAVGAVAIIIAPTLAFGRVEMAPGPARIVAMAAAVGLAIVWAVAFSTLAFRRLDEFHQTASKFAWYWGGLLGLAASLPAYVFIALGGLHWLDPADFHLGLDLARAFRIGYLLPVAFQVAGFLAVRVWWRAAKR